MNILITGAAGYIGSHCVLKLNSLEHSLFGLDILKPHNTSLFQKFYVGDHGNTAFIRSVFKEERIECIIHCSGSSSVIATIEDPIKYYSNDLMGTIFLLRTALEENVKKLLFLSSAQVYGNVAQLTATEDTPTLPIHPLGRIKLAVEQLIESLTVSHELHAISLRITNVIGMDPKGATFPQGNDLLSNMLLDDTLTVFGDHCSTADHTPERDFIHVNDVVQAIILALQKLSYWRKYSVYNISSGRTYSVKDLISAVGHKIHPPLNVSYQQQRPGEIERLSVDSRLAQRELDWHLQYLSLDYIIDSMIDWLRSHEAS
ncbi:MAG: NAD-dependent epimerase/dehydratase family protein [Puniceicoccales bacterium]|nr:NAD-dependent epimerase/dehydratase family protein [Puniceicoccales bacterium]